MAITYSDPDVDTDADIADIAALEPANGDMLYWATGGTRYNTTPSQSYGRSLLNTASAAAFGTTVGGLSIASTSGTSKTLSAWLEDVVESDADFLTPEDYGAAGDGVYFQAQGVMSAGSASFFCGNGVFTSADVGKPIVVQGAGAARVRASAAAVNAGGASYVVGDLLTVSGGTSTYVTMYRVTAVSAGAVTAVELWEDGVYTTLPSNPVSVTGGSGSGCTLNLTGTTIYLPLSTTIASYTSATTVTLSATATTAVTSASFAYGTDDTTAFQNMETARIQLPWGTSAKLRGGAVYIVKNLRILSRESGGPGRTQEEWYADGGRAHLICISPTDTSYMVASNRWVDGQNWTGYPNSPITMRNIRFNGSNLVKWANICKGYQCEFIDCEFAGGLVGDHKICRMNQYEQKLTITGDTTNGSNIITNATFVSSTGSATSLSDIRLYHIIEGGTYSGVSGSTYISAINVGAGTITVSQNATATATGVTFTINKNGVGNGYNSECRVERCEYIASTAIRKSVLFRNEGTISDPGDASTDGYFIDNIVDGQDVTTHGMFFGNIGGWFISGQHCYASTWDMFIYELGGNYRFFDNQFEYPVYIYKVGTGMRVIESNTFWQSVTVGFISSTATELLIFQDPKFTNRETNYAQLKCAAAYANKTVLLFNPTFNTGTSATGTAPITRTNSLGTIIVQGGRDGDGDMGQQVWDDSATGVRRDHYHVSDSPAANDIPWRHTYSAKNASAAKKTYASDEIFITDVTAGSEDAIRRMYVSVAGTETLRFTLGPDVNTVPVPMFSAATGGAAVGYYALGEGSVSMTLTRRSADTSGPEITFTKSRGTVASPADVIQSDAFGKLVFLARAGGSDRTLSSIIAVAEASNPSAGSGDGESSLNFYVTQAAAVSQSLMMKLKYADGLQLYGSSVLKSRKTGWATATGTATRTTFDTTTVTTQQLAERVKALIDDLHATAGHGLIGT